MLFFVKRYQNLFLYIRLDVGGCRILNMNKTDQIILIQHIQQFLEYLNNKHKSIKFTVELSKNNKNNTNLYKIGCWRMPYSQYE